MREKFIRFMQGRNGLDNFSRFLLYFGIVLMLVTMFIRIPIIYYLALAIVVYGYFRVFSRNYARRAAENRWYLGIKQRIANFFKGGKNNSYTQQYKIFKCPGCKQKLRVPRGKGRIQISCSRCKREFIKRS